MEGLRHGPMEMGRRNGFLRSSNQLNSIWWSMGHKGQGKKKLWVPNLAHQVIKGPFTKMVKGKKLLEVVSRVPAGLWFRWETGQGVQKSRKTVRLQTGWNSGCWGHPCLDGPFCPWSCWLRVRAHLRGFSLGHHGTVQTNALQFLITQQLPLTEHSHSTQCHLTLKLITVVLYRFKNWSFTR